MLARISKVSKEKRVRNSSLLVFLLFELLKQISVLFLTAFSGPLPGVSEVLSEWGSLYILTSENTVSAITSGCYNKHILQGGAPGIDLPWG